MQSYNKLFIKHLFFNTENGDEVRCPEWHTTGDTMDAISSTTLGEVGQTLLNVIADLER